MKAKILKALTHEGKKLPSGTIVDVSTWRNARSLESMRYITFVVEEEVKAEEKVETPKPKTVKTKTTD